MITHLAKGDTALSVTLTAVNSLLTIITIPFIVQFALSEFMSDDSVVESPVVKFGRDIVCCHFDSISNRNACEEEE